MLSGGATGVGTFSECQVIDRPQHFRLWVHLTQRRTAIDTFGTGKLKTCRGQVQNRRVTASDKPLSPVQGGVQALKSASQCAH